MRPTAGWWGPVALAAADEAFTAAADAGGVTGLERGRRLGGLRALLEAERERWFNWVPVLIGAGIALYFALPTEPALAAALAPLAVSLALRLVMPRGILVSALIGMLIAVTLGLAAAKVRTGIVAAPILEREVRAATVTGWVELIEPRPTRGERLTILVAAINALGPDARPERVRVRTLKARGDLKPGAPVRLKATLAPPSGPPLPGGYDFARSAYYQRIGAVGYAMTAAEDAPELGPAPWRLEVAAAIQRVRQAIGARVSAVLPGETGAIANALITGERGGISEKTNDVYRDGGIFHILSISGLHMSIMAGAVFVSIRFLLALWPAVALRYPIKKWAAAGAAIGALGYLMISGGASATVRSYLMISVMFLAVLLDRPGIALRNVAIAALLILLWAPEALHDVGFQMSFAAVVALVSGYEAMRDRARARPRARLRGPAFMIVLFLGGIILTTLLASIAVAPLAAYHFHKSQQYAILANLIAIPICNVIVMPAALATLVAMPFGLEALPLKAMAFGIEGMSWCARVVADLPGAVGRIPAIPVIAFALMVVGGLWLALWRTRWRLLGLGAIAVGIALAPGGERPDLYVGRDGLLLAARLDGRLLTAPKGRGSQFELQRWLEHDGDERTGRAVASGAGFRCDGVGCTAMMQGRLVAMPSHPAALADDCARADILVLRWPKPAACQARGTVIDYYALHDEGVHTVRLVAGGRAVVTSVAQMRGDRPWTGSSRRRPVRIAPAVAGSRLGAFAAPHELVEAEDVRPDLAAEAAGVE